MCIIAPALREVSYCLFYVYQFLWSSDIIKRLFQKYKKPKFIQCFTFSLTGDVLTGDSEGNILTWGKSAADIKTLGKGAKGQTQMFFFLT